MMKINTKSALAMDNRCRSPPDRHLSVVYSEQ